jgi:hypothetical protein
MQIPQILQVFPRVVAPRFRKQIKIAVNHARLVHKLLTSRLLTLYVPKCSTTQGRFASRPTVIKYWARRGGRELDEN